MYPCGDPCETYYKLLAFPLAGMSITPRSLVYNSILAWVVSGILGVPYGLTSLLTDIYIEISNIITSILICLFTVIPIVTYHILKTRKIREGITSRTNAVRSMNKMVVAICAVQIISTTSTEIGIILRYAFGFKFYLQWLVQILLLMNHVMNPILFFYFTSCHRALNVTSNNRVHRNLQCDTSVWRDGNQFCYLKKILNVNYNSNVRWDSNLKFKLIT